MKPVKVKIKGYFANGKLKSAGKHVITHRVIANVELGELVSIQNGYKLCVGLSPELAAKGLISIGYSTNGKILLTVMNVGREIVEIKADDLVANYWVEPIIEMDVQGE